MAFEAAAAPVTESTEGEPGRRRITTNVGSIGTLLEERARDAGATFSYGRFYAALAKGMLGEHHTRSKDELSKLASAMKKIESISDADEALAATNAFFAEHAGKGAKVMELDDALSAAMKRDDWNRVDERDTNPPRDTLKVIKEIGKAKSGYAFLGYEMELVAQGGTPGVLDLGDLGALAGEGSLSNFEQRTYIHAATTALIDALPLTKDERATVLTNMGHLWRIKIPSEALRAANEILAPYHLSLIAQGVETKMGSTDAYWEGTRHGAQ